MNTLSSSNQKIEKTLIVSLVLDETNVINQLSQDWDDKSSHANAKPSLLAKNVLGRHLKDFISDDVTTMYIETVLKLARLKKQTLFREYRCDSPTKRRFMEMEIIPLENKFLKINHYLLYEEPLEKTLYLKDTQQDKKLRPSLLRCSMCNRLRASNETKWLPAEAFHSLENNPLRVIHTVCESCANHPWKVRPQT